MKQIKITEQAKQSLLEDFKDYLSKVMIGNSVSFNKTISEVDNRFKNKKATVLYSSEAWRKQQALIREFNSEVAWHGIVERKSTQEYYIKDILVYPQTVTGVTVDMDEVEYGRWTMEIDAEILETMRMQGHSHVEMGCFPSGTDTHHQDEIVKSLGKQDFYIFIIANKKESMWACIYDMTENVMWENNDIEVQYETDIIDDFINKAKTIVVEKKFFSNNRYHPQSMYKWGDYDYGCWGVPTDNDCWSDQKIKKEETETEDDYKFINGRFEVK